MPTYDYICDKCLFQTEIIHLMSDDSLRPCPECHTNMTKQIGIGYLVTSGFKPSLEDLREANHSMMVKDKERAIRMRKKAFGRDSVGDPVDSPDPKHIVRRGRTLGGRQMEIDKQEFVKAAAKDPYIVKQCQDIVNKQKPQDKS